MKEKAVRSATKAFSWRVTGTIYTIIVFFIVTGKPHLAFTIGGVEVVTKLLLYFVHERIWNKVKWGTAKEDAIEYHI